MSATYFSHKVESNQAVVQARMTERDLIQEEALDKTRVGTPTFAYPIPVADNRVGKIISIVERRNSLD